MRLSVSSPLRKNAMNARWLVKKSFSFFFSQTISLVSALLRHGAEHRIVATYRRAVLVVLGLSVAHLVELGL